MTSVREMLEALVIEQYPPGQRLIVADRLEDASREVEARALRDSRVPVSIALGAVLPGYLAINRTRGPLPDSTYYAMASLAELTYFRFHNFTDYCRSKRKRVEFVDHLTTLAELLHDYLQHEPNAGAVDSYGIGRKGWNMIHMQVWSMLSYLPVLADLPTGESRFQYP